MYVERILCPIVTLGPNKRLVLWTKGCTKACKGCISPEMADTGDAKPVAVSEIYRIIENVFKSEGFEGVTISGGDPFEQLPELLELVKMLRRITDDILVYTGFVWDEFSKTLSPETIDDITRNISVLIDGPYIPERNKSGLALRGSDNQNIIFFDAGKKKVYEGYIKNGRTLQNVYMDDKVIVVGILDR